MADKKPDKKPDKKFDKKPPEGGNRPVEIIIAEVLILGGLLLGLIIILMGWFGAGDVSETGGVSFGESFQIFFIGLLSSAQAISAFVSLLFIMGIIYVKFKIGQMERAKKLETKIKQAEEKKVIRQAASENKKWKKVIEHVTSPNPSDWRLSILEADILLGELLTKMGYKGEGIGEQLKSVEPSDFTSLNEAWEAHKIRNSIAHEGSDFVLSQREAKRVIGLFEQVFKEFYFI